MSADIRVGVIKDGSSDLNIEIVRLDQHGRLHVTGRLRVAADLRDQLIKELQRYKREC